MKQRMRTKESLVSKYNLVVFIESVILKKECLPALFCDLSDSLT